MCVSGQLFAHLGLMGESHLSRGLGYIDDDELLSIIHKHRSELLAPMNRRTHRWNSLRPRQFLASNHLALISQIVQSVTCRLGICVNN